MQLQLSAVIAFRCDNDTMERHYKDAITLSNEEEMMLRKSRTGLLSSALAHCLAVLAVGASTGLYVEPSMAEQPNIKHLLQSNMQWTEQESKAASLLIQDDFLHSTIKQTSVPGARIIGGTQVQRAEYPFMAALVRMGASEDLSRGHFCGASIIDNNYVITAAHCLEGADARDIAVWVGGKDLMVPDQGQFIPAYSLIMHEDYQGLSLDNDIAVIELAYPAVGVQPVALVTPELDAAINEGELLAILGWGARSDPSDDRQLQPLSALLEAEVPRYNRAQCEDIFEGFFAFQEESITDNMMCAGRIEGGVDTCFGDSGGPLLYKHNNQWAIAGITSFGDGCGGPESPGVYARVSRYVDWVASKTHGFSVRQNYDLKELEQGVAHTTQIQVRNLTNEEIQFSPPSIAESQSVAQIELGNGCGASIEPKSICGVSVSFTPEGAGRGVVGVNLMATISGEEVAARTDVVFSSLGESGTNYGSVLDLDNLSGQWLDGGNQPWQIVTDSVTGASVVSSGSISDDEISILQFNNTDTSILGFDLSYRVSSEENFDNFNIYVNDSLVFSGSGDVVKEYQQFIWTVDTDDAIGYIESIRFEYAKDSFESGGEDNVFINGLDFLLSSDVVDAGINTYVLPSTINYSSAVGLAGEPVEWFTGGIPWVIQSDQSVSGEAISSGGIDDSAVSVVMMRINDASVTGLTFNYLVSSEEDFDFFHVYLNGEKVLTVTGEIEDLKFLSETITFEEQGENEITFEYIKDSSFGFGLDTVFLDDFELMRPDSGSISSQGEAKSSVANTANDTKSNSLIGDNKSSGGSMHWLLMLMSTLLLLARKRYNQK